VLLGAEVPVVELFAGVLRRVADEARRVAAADFDAVVLSYPAGSGGQRRGALERAAAAVAGLGPVALVAEPVSAARHFLAQRRASGTGGDRTGRKAPMVIYDLGGGAFDVAVVDGDRVLAADGLPDVGGLDIDTALLRHLVDTDPENA
jgi:molecular chaperone DnaK (HSP70)